MVRRLILRWIPAAILLLAGVVAVESFLKACNCAREFQGVLHLHVICMALHSYEQREGGFPPPAIVDAQGRPLLSWRVLLLKHLDEEALYKEFRLDEPWDSPHNLALLPRMPKYYKPYPGYKSDPPYSTYWQVFVGPGAAFEMGKRFRYTDFTDGPDQTILIAEGGRPVPWTKPEDLTYDPNGPLPELGGLGRRSILLTFADDMTKHVSRPINEEHLRAAITRAGGEPRNPLMPRR